MIVAAALLAVGGAQAAMPISIAELARRMAALEGRVVTTCGWATRPRDGGQISENRDASSGASVAVAWRDDAGIALKPVKMCVTGEVRVGCARTPPGTDSICIGPDWLIQQTVEPER